LPATARLEARKVSPEAEWRGSPLNSAVPQNAVLTRGHLRCANLSLSQPTEGDHERYRAAADLSVVSLADVPRVAVGMVGPIVKKQAQKIGKFVRLLRTMRPHRTARRAGVAYLAGGASLLAFCAGLAVLNTERSSPPSANITDFGDAAWWAVTTTATVGYGDRFPITGIGRLVGFGLMVGGIALVSIVTATLMSSSVESVWAAKKQTEALRHMA
jgi:voltage-gated potassium channel Kch